MKDDKRTKMTLTVEAVVGVVIAIIGWNSSIDYYSSLIFAAGVGLASGAISQIIRIMYWNSPKHKQEYETRKQEAHINAVDERKRHIREKAGDITNKITMIALMILMVILALLHVKAWIVLMVLAIFLFQWIVWTVAFHRLEKRM